MTASNPFIFTSFVFTVKSKITLSTTFASKYLFLHAADIRATAAALSSSLPVQLADIVYASDLELSIVVLSGLLVDPPSPPPSSSHRHRVQPATSNLVLSIDNLGVLNDDMRGFYRSKEDAHKCSSKPLLFPL
jgi:hypothetical protein